MSRQWWHAPLYLYSNSTGIFAHHIIIMWLVGFNFVKCFDRSCDSLYEYTLLQHWSYFKNELCHKWAKAKGNLISTKFSWYASSIISSLDYWYCPGIIRNHTSIRTPHTSYSTSYPYAQSLGTHQVHGSNDRSKTKWFRQN